MAECIWGGQLDPIARTVVLHSPTPPQFFPFYISMLAERLLASLPQAKGQREKRTCEYCYEENPNCKLIFLLYKTTFLFKVRLMWNQIPDSGTGTMQKGQGEWIFKIQRQIQRHKLPTHSIQNRIFPFLFCWWDIIHWLSVLGSKVQGYFLNYAVHSSKTKCPHWDTYF